MATVFVGDVFEGIRVQDHQVGQLAGFQRAYLPSDPHDFGGPFRGPLENFHWCQAGVLHQNLHFVNHRGPRRRLVAAVGAHQHTPAGLEVHFVEAQCIPKSLLAALFYLLTRMRRVA